MMLRELVYRLAELDFIQAMVDTRKSAFISGLCIGVSMTLITMALVVILILMEIANG